MQPPGQLRPAQIVTTLKPAKALRLDLPAGMLVGAEKVVEQEVPV
jgi:hypothetical protein